MTRPATGRRMDIKIQSKGRRKGFPKGKGGSPKITGIVENDKEYKGNSMISRPPPEPHFPRHHRRPTVVPCRKVARPTLCSGQRSPSPSCLETVVFESPAPGGPAWIKVPPLGSKFPPAWIKVPALRWKVLAP